MKDQRSDQELNRIIAEWMGWVIAINPNHCHLKNAGRLPNGWYDGWQEIPSYCTDLNVIHEAEKKLTDTQWDLYEDKILENAGNDFDKTLLHAEARQRAEAIVAIIEFTK